MKIWAVRFVIEHEVDTYVSLHKTREGAIKEMEALVAAERGRFIKPHENQEYYEFNDVSYRVESRELKQ